MKGMPKRYHKWKASVFGEVLGKAAEKFSVVSEDDML